MKSQMQHDRDVEDLRSQFLMHQADKKSISLNSAHLSNTMRQPTYKQGSPQLNIEHFNQFIHIDTERKIAFVEPRVTMDQLIYETSLYGLTVPVVPEFKGITVGGAIMGTALESSSYKHGQFNDICLSYEILLGNGTVITATPYQNEDLFYGISGSYGSLGIILGVEIKLIPASQWIRLHYHPFSDLSKAIHYLKQTQSQSFPPDYLEGVVFGTNHAVIIEGYSVRTEEDVSKIPTLNLSAPWSPWYYQHVKNKNYASDLIEKITPYDYMFRHNRGAFWIGAYAQHWSLFFNYFIGARFGWDWLAKKCLGDRNFNSFSPPKDPSLLFRSSIGWSLTSRCLYQWLHNGTESWVASKFIVQDFYIPQDKALTFINNVLDQTGIVPIWLCPIVSTSNPQWFAPHFQNDSQGSSNFINVGVYGIPSTNRPSSEAAHSLEKLAQQLNGRKMLYSQTYYSKNDFWNIYSKEAYTELREKYHANGVWTSIEDKVLQCTY